VFPGYRYGLLPLLQIMADDGRYGYEDCRVLICAHFNLRDESMEATRPDSKQKYSYGWVSNMIQELERLKLIQYVGRNKNGKSIFEITDLGRRIIRVIEILPDLRSIELSIIYILERFPEYQRYIESFRRSDRSA
jgi:predicted transcriptional regulator